MNGIVKKQVRGSMTTHTHYWHVRLITKEGVYHPDNIGFVVMVDESELYPVRRGPKKQRDPVAVAAASYKEAIRRVESFADLEGEFAGYELTADILEFGVFKATGVAQLY